MLLALGVSLAKSRLVRGQAIGLVIPQSLLLRADDIIQ
jgi:hypothetical protein